MAVTLASTSSHDTKEATTWGAAKVGTGSISRSTRWRATSHGWRKCPKTHVCIASVLRMYHGGAVLAEGLARVCVGFVALSGERAGLGGKCEFAGLAKASGQRRESGHSRLRFKTPPCCTIDQSQQCAGSGICKLEHKTPRCPAHVLIRYISS